MPSVPATAAERVYRDLTVRAFEVRADSWDEKTRSFELTISTEAPVTVMDLARWEPIDEVLVSQGCKLPKNRQVPLLDSHNRYSVKEAHLGSARGIVAGEGQVTGRAYLASTEEEVAVKVREGHVTDCSAGYLVRNSVLIEAGQTAEVNGKSYTAPAARALRVTTEWMLKEVSLCPIGADEDAKIREEPAGGEPARKEAAVMAENTPAPAGAPAAPPAAPAPAPVERTAPKPEVRDLEEEIRARTIRALCPRDCPELADRLVAEGKSVDEARAEFLKRFVGKPVGAAEPETAPAKPAAAAGPKLSDVSDDELKRSLFG